MSGVRSDAPANGSPDELPEELTGGAVRVLILGASHPDLALDLGREAREVAEALRPLRRPAYLEVVQNLAVSPADLSELADGTGPTVIHLIGHGTSVGLELRSEDGGTVTVRGADLRAVLAGRSVDLVVLNCCSSALVAEELALDGRAAIGVEGPVADNSSIGFSRTFYRRLAAGDTIATAFGVARDAVRLVDDTASYVCFGSADRILFAPDAALRWPTRSAAAAGAPARSGAGRPGGRGLKLLAVVALAALLGVGGGWYLGRGRAETETHIVLPSDPPDSSESVAHRDTAATSAKSAGTGTGPSVSTTTTTTPTATATATADPSPAGPLVFTPADVAGRVAAIVTFCDGLGPADHGTTRAIDGVTREILWAPAMDGTVVTEKGVSRRTVVIGNDDGEGPVLVAGGDDAEHLIADRADVVLCGGPGADVLDVTSGRNILIGGEGSDELNGGTGPDVVVGAGDDALVHGGAGDDLCSPRVGTAGVPDSTCERELRF